MLDRLGIELIGPEHLVTAKVSVRATASDSPKDDRRARFGKEALVEWEAIIDDTPISEAEMARAEVAGTTLMRAGHRWVKIDPAGLRRAKQLLEAQAASPTIGAVDLLRRGGAFARRRDGRRAGGSAGLRSRRPTGTTRPSPTPTGSDR